MKRAALAVLLAVGTLALPVCAQNLDEGDDPEHGVARLSLINGDVSIQRGDSGETIAGELNAPLVALDHVLTAQGSRAEVQFDWSNMIRLGPASEIRLGDLRDGNYLIQVAEGTTTFRVLREMDAQVEIATPTVSVRPTQKGIYRIMVRPDGSTQITVRSGRAEIFTPRGSETLNSGKTMEARGTVDDPEYMIGNAIPRDEWDTWNENRDRDLERSQSYRYTSRDVYGADDLDAHGRWVYDQPYGNVWVPNVAAGWAPYRIGRWSYINYYGWTWISGDPWGWAPYHYGRWYSSPYGWAWYPGVIGPRYYWRPALVGFFGWGAGGVNIGVGIGGGWGWGNVGWVPLAPYERFRPWYGRRGTTIINNTTIVNNTNITNIYRNARQFNGRDGVTSVRAGDFGQQRINGDNFVRGRGNDFARAGEVRGGLPFGQSQDSRRFSDRNPAADTVARAGQERNFRFASAAQNEQVVRDRATANGGGNVANVARDRGGIIDRAGFAERGTSVDRGTRSTAQPAGQNNGVVSTSGWRRFDPSTSVSRGTSANRTPSASGRVVPGGGNASSIVPNNSGIQSNGRRFSSAPSNPSPRYATPSPQSTIPNSSSVMPSSRSRSSSPSVSRGFSGGGGNNVGSGGGGGSVRSAPSAPAQSAPRMSAPSASSSGRATGGGSRSSAPSGGGGGGGMRAAPSGGGGGSSGAAGGGRRR